jgi:hypothetical protein
MFARKFIDYRFLAAFTQYFEVTPLHTIQPSEVTVTIIEESPMPLDTKIEVNPIPLIVFIVP